MKDIYTEYFVFMREAKNVYISSVDENTKPEISYSPCVVDNEKKALIDYQIELWKILISLYLFLIV